MTIDRPKILVMVAMLLAGLVAIDKLRTSDETSIEAGRQTEIGVRQEHAVGEGARDAVDRSNPLATKTVEDFPDIVNRSLFSPDRRPPNVVGDASGLTAPGLAATMDGFDLVGFASTPGGNRFAVLRRKNADGIVWISEGKMIDGWTLRQAGERDAIFERAGAVARLTIVRSGAAGTSPAASEPGEAPMRAIIPTDSMLGLKNGSSD